MRTEGGQRGAVARAGRRERTLFPFPFSFCSLLSVLREVGSSLTASQIALVSLSTPLHRRSLLDASVSFCLQLLPPLPSALFVETPLETQTIRAQDRVHC